MNKKVTMRDIAGEMNVSTVTVSKAISGKDGVSDEVRAAILKKAEEMGYQYSAGAKEEQETVRTIGILVPDRFFSDNAFYSNLYRVLLLKSGERGISAMLEIVPQSDEDNLVLPKMVSGGKVDGVIFLGQIKRKYIETLAATGLPFISLDFYDETYPVDSVVSDGLHGSYRVTNYLIKTGHKKIGFIGTKTATSSILDRYLGFCKAMLLGGLKINQDWVISDRNENGKFIYLALPEDGNMPEAFVCNCDEIAFILIKALNDRGYSVPGDVSVVGFDDHTIATMCNPPLTTFRVDMSAMGEEAVSLLIRKMKRKKYAKGRTVISGSLIVRKSVRDRSGG
jgi:LacI family transcriptional regulator